MKVEKDKKCNQKRKIYGKECGVYEIIIFINTLFAKRGISHCFTEQYHHILNVSFNKLFWDLFFACMAFSNQTIPPLLNSDRLELNIRSKQRLYGVMLVQQERSNLNWKISLFSPACILYYFF